MAPGLKACGSLGPRSEWGLGKLGAMGKTESYHLPRFPRSREKIQVPPSRPLLLGHLPCPQSQSITAWSSSKPDGKPLT